MRRHRQLLVILIALMACVPALAADGADNIGTALLLELPDRAAADAFWNNEPFARNGGYQRDARIVRWVFGD